MHDHFDIHWQIFDCERGSSERDNRMIINGGSFVQFRRNVNAPVERNKFVRTVYALCDMQNAKDSAVAQGYGTTRTTELAYRILSRDSLFGTSRGVVQSASCVAAAYTHTHHVTTAGVVSGRKAISSRKVRPISRSYSRG